jgi:hypothetical protein
MGGRANSKQTGHSNKLKSSCKGFGEFILALLLPLFVVVVIMFEDEIVIRDEGSTFI